MRIIFSFLLFALLTNTKEDTKFEEFTHNKFEDPNFPASPSSLYTSDRKQEAWQEASWAHISRLFPEGYKIFSEGITPNDISQGALGDCYFLSALAALAERPERVRKIFITEEVNEEDKYILKFFLDGTWKEITIDGMFPATAIYSNTPDPKRPYFAGTTTGEIWPLLAEKAWAKVNDNYENIIGGLVPTALRVLTGCPYKFLYHDIGDDYNADQLWELLLHADRNDFLIGAAGGGRGASSEEYERLGIVTDHAYSVISVREVYVMGEGHRVLKLRNPWGSFEWRGRWSDQSEIWTPELKGELRWTDVDDGTFFISLTDYLKYYSRTGICYSHESYVQANAELTHEIGENSIIHMSLHEDTMGYISLDQISQRVMRMTNPDYAFSKSVLILSEVLPDGSFNYITDHSCFSEDICTLSIDDPIPMGEYVIFAQAHWEHDVNKVTLTTFTDRPVQLTVFPGGHELRAPILIAAAESKRSSISVYKYDGEFTNIRNYVIGFRFGYYWILTNGNNDLEYDGEYEYTLDNYAFADGATKFSAKVGPQETIIKEMRRMDVYKGASWSGGSTYTVRKL